MSAPFLRSLLVCAGILAGGCNLSEPASSFAYQGEYVVISFDAGNNGTVDDGTPDEGVPDLGPVGAPELVITEILIHSDDTKPGAGERGEFIEIKNVGDGAARPRAISLVIIDPAQPDEALGRIQVAEPLNREEVEIVGGLKLIEPGEYFVFVRHEVATSPISELAGKGRFYDYGRYANGPSLTNDAERIIELRYNEGPQIVTFDSIRYGNGELRPLDDDGTGLPYLINTSIGAMSGFEDPESNNDPENWCLSRPYLGDEEKFRGTPGRAAECVE